MAYRFSLEPVDRSFFETAPNIDRRVMDLAASPDEVWRGLTVKRPLSWCRALTSVEFEGEGPYGQGAVRHVTVVGAMRMEERFFHWDEEGRGYSFHATSANVPLFTSFAEDYRVEEIPGGSRLTWTFASLARPGLELAVKAGGPVNRLVYSALAADTRKRFGQIGPGR